MGGEDAPDEFLDAGQAPSPGRRLLGALVATLLLVVIVAVARRHGSDGGPVNADPTNVIHHDNGPDVIRPPVGPAATSDDAVYADGAYFVARGHDLVAVRSADGNQQAVIDNGVGSPRYRLLADPVRHRVWVVRLGDLPAATAFDSRTLHQVQTTELAPGVATDAALLDGALVVAGGRKLLTVTEGVRAPRDLGTYGGFAVAADPVRHRVVVLDLAGATVRATSYGARGMPGPSTRLAFDDATLLVAGGQVWVLGSTRNSDVLQRLDATTLRPVTTSALMRRHPFAPKVAAVGRYSFLIRSTASDHVWCVDAKTGAVAQMWSGVQGALGYAPDGTIFSLPADGFPAALAFGGCPG